MKQQTNTTPLWRELKNAANLEGLHIGEFLELVSKKSLNIAITDNAAEGADLASCINSYKEMASFKYADLAKNNLHKLAEALEGLTKEINLSKLNIRKDFSLINAHAAAKAALASIS